MTASGWFSHGDSTDVAASANAIRTGRTDSPANWPQKAMQSGFVPSEQEYYARLHEASLMAANAAIVEHEQSPDRELIHAIRALDEIITTENELSERVTDWARSHYGETDSGREYVRTIAEKTPESPIEHRIIELASLVDSINHERNHLKTYIENAAPRVAPNLTMLAGSLLAARLIAAAGGLKALARKPSGTVQVLGAESALFAHLKGDAPSPKHGLIYTHTAIQSTPVPKRGKAARALAGKLTIAARIDYYSGEQRPELADDLADRLETIHQLTDR